jgi:acetyl-CoA C-acetyltransferase
MGTSQPGSQPARQAGLGAGMPRTHRALTVNKVCSSGLMAVAPRAPIRPASRLVVAGGMELSRALPLAARRTATVGNARCSTR